MRLAAVVVLLCVLATDVQARTKGDPDIPTKGSAAPVLHVAAPPKAGTLSAGRGFTILSPCQMCEDSNGNAVGSCMVCRIGRRFAALGGW